MISKEEKPLKILSLYFKAYAVPMQNSNPTINLMMNMITEIKFIFHWKTIYRQKDRITCLHATKSILIFSTPSTFYNQTVCTIRIHNHLLFIYSQTKYKYIFRDAESEN